MSFAVVCGSLYVQRHQDGTIGLTPSPDLATQFDDRSGADAIIQQMVAGQHQLASSAVILEAYYVMQHPHERNVYLSADLVQGQVARWDIASRAMRFQSAAAAQHFIDALDFSSDADLAIKNAAHPVLMFG